MSQWNRVEEKCSDAKSDCGDSGETGKGDGMRSRIVVGGEKKRRGEISEK